MSSTNRGSERPRFDFYETPAWSVHRLLEELFPATPGADPMPYFAHWVEPCAGNGAIIRAVNEWTAAARQRIDIQWQACELDHQHSKQLSASLGRDSLGLRLGDTLAWHDPDIHYQRSRFDVAILNPPYRQALEFVQWSVEHSQTTIALLRLGFLETTQRNAWLRTHTPDVYVLPNRPSFTGKGNDSTAYAWFIWRHNRTGRQVGEIRVLPDTPRKAREIRK